MLTLNAACFENTQIGILSLEFLVYDIKFNNSRYSESDTDFDLIHIFPFPAMHSMLPTKRFAVFFCDLK